MKKKLERGDKVKVNGFSENGYNCDGYPGVIQHFFGAGNAEVLFETGDRRTFCISQLVRLMKKPPRKRVWVHPAALDGALTERNINLLAKEIPTDNWIEFVEVRKKK